MKIQILDTTLRDGAQGHGITFSNDDKLQIIRLLDSLAVDAVEVVNFNEPPSGLSEFYTPFLPLFSTRLRHTTLTAFGSTCRPGERPEDDRQIRSVISSPFKQVSIFGKSWLLHVENVLRTTPEENLRMISATVAYFVEHGISVIFDAEHFFDGYADSPEYALSVLNAAKSAGASTLVLCDTNGGRLPSEIGRVVGEVKTTLGGEIPLGIHCHNDIGMADAASVLAVQNGATMVQGTISGIGERCGNANLNVIIPLLSLKLGCKCLTRESLRRLTPTARLINELANHAFDESEPFVGGHAFSHKAGMHIDGVKKLPKSFEHIDPAEVGNERGYVVSCLSGRAAILGFLADAAPEITGLDKYSDTVRDVLNLIRSKENAGFSYEDAYASLELLVRNFLGLNTSAFSIVSYQVTINESAVGSRSTAMVKVRVGESETLTAAEGEGPVNALDRALRSALSKFYPKVERVRLTDYRVRVLNSGRATASVVRVVIESTNGRRTWRTTGASVDIIEASLHALADSYEFALKK